MKSQDAAPACVRPTVAHPYLRDLAHEFNNALTSIQSMTYVLSFEGNNTGTQRSCCQSILEQISRAKELTLELQKYARLGQKENHSFDVNGLVHEIVEMLRLSAGSDLIIRLDLDDEPVRIEVNRLRMEQVLVDLCTNVIESLGSKGVLTLHTRMLMVKGGEPEIPAVLTPGRYCEVQVIGTVRDAASHFKAPIPDSLEMMSDKNATLFRLSEVLGILQELQGGIKVDGAPGENCCFTLYFPTARKTLGLDAKERADVQARTGGATVLVVDDEEGVLNANSGMLGILGYRVLTAPSGEIALEMFQERPQEIDLVMIDVEMPALNGRATAKIMRMVKPNQRFVFTSGITEEASIDILRQEGFRHFIGKPYSMKKLQSIIRHALEEKLE